MLRAIFFDFNGVIVDDEPLHMACFQRVLAEEGISLSKEDYYALYIGMDDRTCFKTVFQKEKKSAPKALLDQLVSRKAMCYQQAIAQESVVVLGVKEFVEQASEKCFLGIVSGALRSEIEQILGLVGLRSYFQVIIAAEDVTAGKPSPEGYVKGLAQLNRRLQEIRWLGNRLISPQECLAIEDAPPGIEAAHAAGMKCLAVTSSFSKKELAAADGCVERLSSQVSFGSL